MSLDFGSITFTQLLLFKVIDVLFSANQNRRTQSNRLLLKRLFCPIKMFSAWSYADIRS